MTELVQDIRFAGRLLRKNPFLTTIAVASLALGIGATAVSFSLVDALLLRPLPAVHSPGALVKVLSVENDSPDRFGSLSWGEYLDYARRTDVVSGLAAVADCDVSLTSGGLAERIPGLAVSPNYFSVLGLRPAQGRLFSPREEQESSIAVLGYGLWRRRFGADPKIIGTSIVLNGQSVTVVGVAPEGFWGTDLAVRRELWLPLRAYSTLAKGVLVPLTGQQDRKQQWLDAVGRLAPGVTAVRAQSVLDAVAKNLAATYPETDAGRGVRVFPLTETALGQGMRPLILSFTARLLGVTILVLVVVAINVAGLLLARGLSRRGEIAVRLSLGASRGRLIRQLLAEGLALGALGTVAGILLADASLPVLEHLEIPGNLTIHDLTLSGRVLALSALVSLASCLGFALLPAIQTVRTALMPALRGKRARGLLRFEAREILVGLQVALALLIMIASGLMLRTLSNLQSIDPGFDPAHVLVFSIDLSPAGYEGPRIDAFYQDFLDRLRHIPGVRGASMASALPVMGGDLTVDLTVSPEDGPMSAADRASKAAVRHALIGSHYFETVGMKLLQGRDFGPEDGAAGMGAVILNETAARLLWPGTNPLGHRLRLVQSKTPFSVVGVVADAKYATLKERAVPVLYLAHSQYQKSFIGSLLASEMTLVVRTSGEPRHVLNAVRKTVRGMDPLLPVFHVSTLEDLLDSTIGVERQAAALYSGLALAAVALALLGLYGVVSNAVAERTREIGIRVACGASPRHIRTLVIRRSALLASIGVAAGLAVAVPASGIVQSQLYGVKTSDPVTWLLTPLILVAAAVSISMIPARHAARIDPVRALRSELTVKLAQQKPTLVSNGSLCTEFDERCSSVWVGEPTLRKRQRISKPRTAGS